MNKEAATSWFGVRTVYLFGKKNDGTHVFEERVVVFSGADFDEALAKAKSESAEYAAALEIEYHPEQIVYEQDGDALIDGYEVWSDLFESTESLEAFYQSRYAKYEYHADE